MRSVFNSSQKRRHSLARNNTMLCTNALHIALCRHHLVLRDVVELQIVAYRFDGFGIQVVALNHADVRNLFEIADGAQTCEERKTKI